MSASWQGGIVYSSSSSGDLGWSDAKVYYSLMIGAIALLIFIVRQLKIDNPILELCTFKFPMFTLSVGLIFIIMMSLFSTMTLLPMFLQMVLLVTAFKSGLIILPGSIISGIMGPVAGKLFDKSNPKIIIIPGIGLVVFAMWLFSGINGETTLTQIILMHSVLTPELYPHGTAIFNTLSQVAGAIGTAIFISKMTTGTNKYMENSVNPMDPVEKVKRFNIWFPRGIYAWVNLYNCFPRCIVFLKRTKKKATTTQLLHNEN